VYATTGSIDAFDNLRHFALHPEDPALQAYRAPYRVYSPAMARWTTRDPLGMVDGPNVYGYVGSKPTCHVDALGESKADPETLVNIMCNANCMAVLGLPGLFMPMWTSYICGVAVTGVCGIICGDSTEQCKTIVQMSPMGIPPGGPWPLPTHYEL